jgi:hypothetical protein
MDTTGQSKWNDSLERYVFVYYRHLLTEAECHAWQYFIQTDKEKGILEADDVFARAMGDAWKTASAQDHAELATAEKLAASRDPVIKRLIEDYPEQFFVSVTYRILRDHGDEVQLNLCRKCLNLCGTPKAKLCLRCGYSWHSEKE